MKKKLNMLLLILVILAASIVTVAPGPSPEPTPTPPPADCSPGFWKQPHHWQYWYGYTPFDLYTEEESGDPNADQIDTLLDALQGGKITRDSRDIVAGWLNAANPDAPCGD